MLGVKEKREGMQASLKKTQRELANHVSSIHCLYPSPFLKVNEMKEPGVRSCVPPSSHSAKHSTQTQVVHWRAKVSSQFILCHETQEEDMNTAVQLHLLPVMYRNTTVAHSEKVRKVWRLNWQASYL